jgi:hypothetical protein
MEISDTLNYLESIKGEECRSLGMTPNFVELKGCNKNDLRMILVDPIDVKGNLVRKVRLNISTDSSPVAAKKTFYEGLKFAQQYFNYGLDADNNKTLNSVSANIYAGRKMLAEGIKYIFKH